MMETIGTDAPPIEVLLVEDSPGDVRLRRGAFKDATVHINLHLASDGTEAMAFLGRDLNLSEKDGREVLEEISESPTLEKHPVT